MGRPLDTRTGPPITIYVPAFARLRDRLTALDGRNVPSAIHEQAEFDAVECVPLRNKSKAYSVFLEVKNELGIAGASGIQCAFIYEKAVALPSVRTACHT